MIDIPEDLTGFPPKKYPFRLSYYGKPCRTARMKQVLAKLGVSVKQYYDLVGDQPINHFQRENPEWSGRAWEVLMLEQFWPGAFEDEIGA